MRIVPQTDGSGSVTAGNSSPLTDGAAALVIASWRCVQARGLPLLAVIRGSADAAQVREAGRGREGGVDP